MKIKAKIKKTEPPRVSTWRLVSSDTAPAVDPATGRPVVRDLRFRKFVAHQRELYFLNLRAGQ